MEKETEVSAGARADDGEVNKDKEEGNMEDQKDKEEAEGEGGMEDTKEGGKDKEKDAQEGEGEEEEDAFLSPLDMLQVILWRIRIFYKVSKTYASLCSISIFFKDFFCNTIRYQYANGQTLLDCSCFFLCLLFVDNMTYSTVP